MRHTLITAAILLLLTAPAAGAAEQGSIGRFVGLWESVDPDDGSHQVLSITDNGDGTVQLLLYDTFFTLCSGGRAIGQGTAVMRGRRSLRSDDFVVKCFETGESKTTPTSFTRNPDGTLARVRSAPLSPITYHRTNN
ncbi:MAG: hypothetical protein AB1714_26485 [Acidobacteriota bacterium]